MDGQDSQDQNLTFPASAEYCGYLILIQFIICTGVNYF